MSSALKLEPRCPDPARFTATSAFSRQMSASEREARVRVALRRADASMSSFAMNASCATSGDGNGR